MCVFGQLIFLRFADAVVIKVLYDAGSRSRILVWRRYVSSTVNLQGHLHISI